MKLIQSFIRRNKFLTPLSKNTLHTRLGAFIEVRLHSQYSPVYYVVSLQALPFLCFRLSAGHAQPVIRLYQRG